MSATTICYWSSIPRDYLRILLKFVSNLPVQMMKWGSCQFHSLMVKEWNFLTLTGSVSITAQR